MDTLFIIAEAAEAQASGGQSQWVSMIPFILMLVVIIWFMTRSQKKQAQQRQTMIDRVTKGSDVVLVGGIFGKIVEVKDDKFVIEIANNVKIEILKEAVSRIVGEKEDDKK